MRLQRSAPNLLALCSASGFLPAASAWVPASCWTVSFLSRSSQCHFSTTRPVIDAEFEPVEDETTKERHRSQASQQSQSSYLQSNEPGFESAMEASLLDLSLRSDPELGNLRVPFMEGEEKCIDTKLGFIAELDGVTYAIGVPYDFPAAITLERKDGSIENVSPDSDENEELMELMAAQLQQHVGEDLRLIRSPRVLTISGPLNNYTANWKEEVLPRSFQADALLNTEDEDLDSFLKFMKEELGEEEFTKTMNEEHFLDDEVLDLFSMSGDATGGDAEIAEFLRQELSDISNTSPDEYSEHQQAEMENVVGKDDMIHDGVALKLVSYSLKNGKQYSLVQLLKPIVLVAKQMDQESGGRSSAVTMPHFELLTPEEYSLVAPRLEEECRADLERLGIGLEESDKL